MRGPAALKLDHVLRISKLSHGRGDASPKAVRADLPVLVLDVVPQQVLEDQVELGWREA